MKGKSAGVIAAILLALGLGGCQTPPSEPPVGNVAFGGLGGTKWRLVEFQSMDDSQGTTRMADPGKYTVTFNHDGTIAARLDCNRAAGSWTQAIANANGGSLQFGPLAVTKAYCPPPSFGETLERHFRFVRSFVVRDGRLAMSLMADGGILVWEPDQSE